MCLLLLPLRLICVAAPSTRVLSLCPDTERAPRVPSAPASAALPLSAGFPSWFCSHAAPFPSHAGHLAPQIVLTSVPVCHTRSQPLFVGCSVPLGQCKQGQGGVSHVCQRFRSVAKTSLGWWCFSCVRLTLMDTSWSNLVCGEWIFLSLMCTA